MQKLKLITLLLATFILTMLVACSQKSSETTEANSDHNENNQETVKDEEEKSEGEAVGGELKVAYSAQPPTLDTYITTSRATNDVARQMFETLLTTDSDYQVQPMLAESWEQSEDGNTITFHLRKGVLFHNGEEMKAEDVVASMNRWKETSSLGKDNFLEATFEEVDEYTVVLQLPKPLSIALPVLAYVGGSLPGIMPKEIVEGADETGVKEFVGTGPFKFEEWKQDQHILLKRFEDYQSRSEESDGLAGKREALVDDLYFSFVTDKMTAIAGIETGEYDIVHGVAPDNVAQIEQNPDIEVLVNPNGPLAVYFNKKKGLFTDPKARQAIVSMMDAEAILTSAYADEKFYELNHNIMTYHQLGQWGTDVGKDLYNQKDTEKAKELLDEAGYNGEEITVITSRDYPHMYNGAVALQQQLVELGMNVNLEVYDWPTLTDIRDDENSYDLMMLSNTDKPEPTSVVYMSQDFSGWTNSPELDDILKNLKESPTIDEAKSYLDELTEWFYDYIPVAKVGDGKAVLANRTSVKNLQDLDGPILWNVSNEK